MDIEDSYDRKITVEEFIDVLKRSTLAERRPVGDRERIAGMLAHANLTCTAWHGGVLIGVSRSVTDYSYCCYLSDLAVDVAHQRMGIGKELVRMTRSRLHPKCKVILLAASNAERYYSKIGFAQHHSAWIVAAKEEIV